MQTEEYTKAQSNESINTQKEESINTHDEENSSDIVKEKITDKTIEIDYYSTEFREKNDICYYYKEIDKIAILPEKSESQQEIAAIIATRTHVYSWNLGDKLLWRMHKLLDVVYHIYKRLQY